MTKISIPLILRQAPAISFRKILQLFAVMVIGFLLVKLKLLKTEDSLTLSRVSLYLLLPAAIINSFQVDLTGDILVGFLFSIAAGIVLHAVLVLTDLAISKFMKGGAVERASVFYSNAANLIIPIVAFVLGDEWVIYSLGFMMVQLIFIWSHGVSLFEEGSGVKLRKILLNPTILAIGAGLIMMLCRVRLPEFVTDITSSFGSVLGYVGMLIAGITAAKLDIKGTVKNPRLYITSLLRVVAVPVITLLLIKVALIFITLEGADKILLISFLATATPSAATVMQLAQLYDVDGEYSVAINILSTLMSCLTIPLFVILYQAII